MIGEDNILTKVVPVALKYSNPVGTTALKNIALYVVELKWNIDILPFAVSD